LTTPPQRSLNVDGEVLDRDNRDDIYPVVIYPAVIYPAVINELTARAMIEVRIVGVEIDGSFESSKLLL